MVREVRITIDDDELFERMKERKQALDLSWEEVLHRGLRPPEYQDDRRASDHRADIDAAKADLKRAIIDLAAEQAGGRGRGDEQAYHDRGGRRTFNPFEPDSIGEFVADTVQQSTGWIGDRDWDDDLDRVTDAEDAVLVFPFLDADGDRETNQIPLRVHLDISGEGLSIEVVTVKRGKDVASMNSFEPAFRQAIVEGIASSELAELRLATGSEAYEVIPLISWSRGDDGRPQADDVAIDEVVFGGD